MRCLRRRGQSAVGCCRLSRGAACALAVRTVSPVNHQTVVVNELTRLMWSCLLRNLVDLAACCASEPEGGCLMMRVRGGETVCVVVSTDKAGKLTTLFATLV